jgi:hypothetical protein
VDRIGSGSCPTTGFGIRGVEPLCSVTEEMISYLSVISQSCGMKFRRRPQCRSFLVMIFLKAVPCF